jgi:hypothetical protein
MKFRTPIAALAATCAVLAACSGSDVSAPIAAPQSHQAYGAAIGNGFFTGGTSANANAGFTLASCQNRKVASYSGTFGPSGGTLVFGDSRLIIPGGALADTVTISATIVDSATSRVEFQPTGLQFRKPAGLLLSTDGCALSGDLVPSVVYLSESGDVLETLYAIWDPRWKTFAAAIWHFSGYAIAF